MQEPDNKRIGLFFGREASISCSPLTLALGFFVGEVPRSLVSMFGVTLGELFLI